MNKLKKRLLAIGIPILLVIIIILMVIHSYSPLYYRAKPIEAWVIDAQTKQPIEGVVVVAYWKLEWGTFGGSYPVGLIKVMEAVTDKNGRFYFPGWGPRLTLFRGVLLADSPAILLFKSGYYHWGGENSFRPEMDAEVIRTSDWDQATIKLKRIKSLTNYKKDIRFLNTSLSIVMEECNWKKIPRMLITLEELSKQLEQHNIKVLTYSAEDVPTNEKKCGSPQKFFERYKVNESSK